MKIGITTLWYTKDNYGGMLQTFALQRYLRNNGHNAFIIRFRNKNKKRYRVILYIKYFMKYCGIRKFDTELCWDKARQLAKKRLFDKFCEEYIDISDKEFYSIQEIKNNYPQCDVYITGSDQVWSRPIEDNPLDRILYLDFGPQSTKRIAYAVSFGHEVFPCGNRSFFTSLVSKFDKVSVREANGVKICKELGINAVRCVDTTLLLDLNIYKSLMAKQKYQLEYVYLYTVNISKSSDIYWTELRDYISKEGLQSIVTTASGFEPARELFDGAIYDYATVNEWLSNIYYSKIVITASFHGVVFSIIFHKDFIYIPLRGNSNSGNNRLYDLLDSYGLRWRQANSFNDICSLFNKHIDYEHIDYTDINKQIVFSKSFLDL